MATEPTRSALLLMDLQNEMVDPKGFFGGMGMAKAVADRKVVGNAKRVLDAARTARMEVIFVRLAFRPDYSDGLSVAPRVQKFQSAKAAVDGTWGTEFPDALKAQANELVISKQSVNPFFNTGLLTYLMSRGIKRLVLGGVSTNAVVEMTLRYADDAGFKVTVLEDCCAAPNQEMHQFAIEKVFPGYGEVTSSADYIKSLESSAVVPPSEDIEE